MRNKEPKRGIRFHLGRLLEEIEGGAKEAGLSAAKSVNRHGGERNYREGIVKKVSLRDLGKNLLTLKIVRIRYCGRFPTPEPSETQKGGRGGTNQSVGWGRD